MRDETRVSARGSLSGGALESLRPLGARRPRRRRTSAFTLLELVVVLGILAILTTLATRALIQVEDQHRFDASQRSLTEIEQAILGDPNERASDGTRVVSGFVADMGRLPQALTTPADKLGPERLTLRELWEQGALPDFMTRRATQANCVAGTPATLPDADVVVAAGWRGPYLRLPLGTTDALDGWGNLYAVPTAGAGGQFRLGQSPTQAIAAAGDPIRYVRHLGSEGVVGAGATPYDEDADLDFSARVYVPALTATVTILEEDSSHSSNGESISVRVFAPYPPDVSKIKVFTNPVAVTSSANSATLDIPLTDPDDVAARVTAGRCAIRAYLTTASGVHMSPVKYIVLQPGSNLPVHLTVHRPAGAGDAPLPPPVTP